MGQIKRFHSNKDSNKFIKQLLSEGWQYVSGNGGHIKIRSPKGHLVSMSNSPSCPHAHKNMVRDVKRILQREADDN